MGSRIIKESIRTSRSVNALSDFLFRVWVHLITYVDDFGRGSADPEILKGFVFPRRRGITEQQISEALHDLASSGMITLYDVDGESYFCFPNWDKHQQIRAQKSKFPAPVSTCNQTISDDNRFPRNPNSNPNPNPNPNTRARECDSDPAFSAFWDAYPRKSGDIKTAYMEYLHVLDGGVTAETLIEAIKRQTTGASEEDLHFIPGAEKWLRNRGWESQVKIASPKNGKNAGFTPASDSKPAAPVDVASLDNMLKNL